MLDTSEHLWPKLCSRPEICQQAHSALWEGHNWLREARGHIFEVGHSGRSVTASVEAPFSPVIVTPSAITLFSLRNTTPGVQLLAVGIA